VVGFSELLEEAQARKLLTLERDEKSGWHVHGDPSEAALIVAQAARHNRQSRGCHYRQDSVSVEGDRLI